MFKSGQNVFDFSNDDCRKYLTKNFDFFIRGYPLFGPSKCGISKRDHPSTALQNPFLIKKCGCLQKTRAQSVKIWPRYKGFKFENPIFKIFHFFALWTKNAINQQVFKIFSIFFLHGKYLHPYSIHGSTLILGGRRPLLEDDLWWKTPFTSSLLTLGK